MTRGVAHPPELRAQVVAAVMAGMTIVQAAAHFNLDHSLVSRWVAQVAHDQRARDPETIGDLLYDLVAEHVATLRAQLQAAAQPTWLEKQPAAELAQLLVAERDTLIRLLAGFRPIQQPELPEPADAAPGTAPDDR